MTGGAPTVHANVVLVGADGVLIRGRPGAGKSALTRALVAAVAAEGRFARLVADDRVLLAVEHGRLVARPPAVLAGFAELRGRGIGRVAYEPAAVVRLVVDLRAPADTERLPAEGEFSVDILGVRLPRQPVPADVPFAVALVFAALAEGAVAGWRVSPPELFACVTGEAGQS